MQHNQLAWACRRGMLELDTLLHHVLKKHYTGFNEEMQVEFQQLLTCQDGDLFRWIFQETCPPKELQHIISLLIACRVDVAHV